MGFDIDQPKIAVVVQKQIDSEKAGIGFSINPITNDYDELVISANWGQGESVVSGLATPDHFIVHKDTLKVKERTLGAKETSIYLQADGSTVERRAQNSGKFCLNDQELITVAEQLGKVEEYYDRPMDIEWAMEGPEVYLLQARPITTYHHLDGSLITGSGERKRLYLDITVSAQGIFEPLSPLGASYLEFLAGRLKKTLFGLKKQVKTGDRLVIFSRGRIYLNVANLTRFLGPKRLSLIMEQMDPLVQEVYRSLDMDLFSAGRVSRVKIASGALSRSWPILLKAVKNFRSPEAARDRWHQQWDLYRKDLEELKRRDVPFGRYLDEVTGRLMTFLCRETLPIFPCAKVAEIRIEKLFPDPDDETRRHLERIDHGLPGNLTVEMGLALYDLHFSLKGSGIDDARTLIRKFGDGSLPPEFTVGWENFLAAYGHRGPMEIDLAARRFREEPSLLLEQVAGFLKEDAARTSPHELYGANQAERRASFEALREQLDKKGRRKFERYYRVLETLGGFRETHKFVLTYTVDQLRLRVLAESARLAESGRMDNPPDVFFMTLDQLTRTLGGENLDLPVIIAESRKQMAIDGQCRQISSVIDSRGRFYRPQAGEVKDGEIMGQAVSPGIAKGTVKVLHAPDEKPIEPGDILVARATDPAWTPLFVNAAAIILEIGGPLQHGALVAREYGKPCVSGVVNATTLLEDGEVVSVDGNSGVIRKVQLPVSGNNP